MAQIVGEYVGTSCGRDKCERNYAHVCIYSYFFGEGIRMRGIGGKDLVSVASKRCIFVSFDHLGPGSLISL
jgi:hypothetical protein